MRKCLFPTVCEELKRQGFLTGKELWKDKIYGYYYVPRIIRIWYGLAIFPIAYLMRICPWITPLVYKIAKKLWLNRSVYHDKN